MNDVAILIPTCSKYMKCWNPFIRSLFHYWPSCPYKIILGTDEDTNWKHEGVKVIVSNQKNYSKHIHEIIEKIQESIILFWIEDRWLIGNPQSFIINEGIKELLNNDNIGYIRLIQQSDYLQRGNKLFVPILDTFPYSISLTIGLWRRSALLKILKKNNSPWSIERSGWQLLQENEIIAKAVNRKANHVFPHIHVIQKGRMIGSSLRRIRALGIFDDIVDSFPLQNRLVDIKDKIYHSFSARIFGGLYNTILFDKIFKILNRMSSLIVNTNKYT